MDDLTRDADLDHHLFRPNSYGSRPFDAAAHFVVRCANQVGIIEAKTGSGVKKGIDQLSTAGEPRNLGTYTQKILVSDQVWDHTLSNLRELAEVRRIEVIELPSFGTNGDLSAEDAETLRRRVCKVLGRDLKT